MPSIQITDFRRGIDRRRERVAGEAGTLWTAKNCHITRGGDLESVKKWDSIYVLPDDTFGINQVNGQIFVFGSSDLAGSMPNGVQYQRLQNSSTAMTRVLSALVFDGKQYIIADYDDGNILHFYDGSAVTDWNTLADAAASYTTLAEYLARKVNADAAVDAISFGASILITAVEPGTAFTISGAVVGSGTIDVTTPQANVAEVIEVRASGTVTITGGTAEPGVNQVENVTVDGVDLMAVPVNWVSSDSATANAVVVEINNNTSDHGYTASAVGAVITLQAAPGTGAAPNGDVVLVEVAGDVTATPVDIADGVTYVAPVAQISKVVFGGTFTATEKFTVTLNSVDHVATGRASAMGTSAFVHKGRVYSTARSAWRYCKLNDPSDWTDATASTGAGFINIASESQGDVRLEAAAVYQGDVALFARSTVRTYSLSADSAENVLGQTVDNSGTVAPQSVAPYFTSEVLFLDNPGVRAVRVRDLDSRPYVDDTGTQVDSLVQEWKASVTETVVERAVAAIEPLDGRYLLAIGERVFVLSYSPRSRIEAWTYYEPGFAISGFARIDTRLYARDEDTIYLYGGVSGGEYPDDDDQDIVVETPFLSVKNPAEFKEWTGFDAAVTNVWRVEVLVDSRDETKVVDIGRITGTTYNHGGIAAIGESTVFALRLTCETGGRASLSSLQVHYIGGDSET